MKLRHYGIRIVGGALLLALLVGCGPEAGRARGGGMGADVGNHPADFQPRSKVFSGEGEP